MHAHAHAHACRPCPTVLNGQLTRGKNLRLSTTAPGTTRPNHFACAALYLGIDFGTSGSRAVVIDDKKETVADARQTFTGAGTPDDWERALDRLLDNLPQDIRSELQGIAINGTSSTALLCDRATGEVLEPPKLYNESQGQAAVDLAARIAPESHTATASSSTLCKLLTWHLDGKWQQAREVGKRPVLLHQADWIAGLLHSRWDTTDWNNCLKLGFDPAEERYPEWLTSQEFSALLPEHVVAPGSFVGKVSDAAAERFGLPTTCKVAAGTTDSVAAFLAAGVEREGEAVTSLGSSMAVKLLSSRRVDDAAFGVYSHRLGDSWLVGGASNTGGAVLKKFFSDQQLQQLTEQIDPAQDPGLGFYPLLTPGERFPINDQNLQPRMEPRPDDDATFLHALLLGISRVEAQAYSQLREMGATPLTKVFTAGGGAKNRKWEEMRSGMLGVPVAASTQGEAAYGAALLAMQGTR